MTGLEQAERLIAAAKKSHVARLDLSGLDLAVVPHSATELPQLESLDLESNRLTAIPAAIAKLSQLQVLVIATNRLTTIPAAIARLSQLRVLALSNNQLTALPAAIDRLSRLQVLDVSFNELVGVPVAICNLSRLEMLNLSNNQLTAIPVAIDRLSQLRSLYLWSNRLTAIPATICKLSRLRHLNLAYNRLDSMPESITQLTQLQYLALSDNRLMTVPESVGELLQLEGLALARNQLTSIPDSAGRLHQLEDLDLSNNQLTTIPESVGRLSRLRVLDLSHNQLTTLPNSLRDLRNLRTLYLHGNELLRIPIEVIGPTRMEVFGTTGATPAKPAEILDYYFRIRTEQRPLNEAKLILVGHGAVGKTSVVNRLVHNKFDEHEAKTEGIKITQWPIALGEPEEARLNIWDFGGQEIMHATHQFFLTERSLYLLVLNGRGGHEDQDAEYWLSLIRSFGGDSPVIVVLNKITEHPFDLNQRALMQKYPIIREFVKTDCKDGTGIKQLREAIEGESDRLEHLRDPFPASWFAIKNRLATMTENYLTYDNYRNLCTKNGETDNKAQENLAVYLNNLGVALNYKDDPRLRDTHVLNPHWVTNGIYTILNANLLKDRNGELNASDLAEILDQRQYPPERHGFLLGLMRKFELCFSFPEDSGRYLIPELLDKQQPHEAYGYKPIECLNFQYKYPVVPEGLLPRFIVRSHVLSTGRPRWRTGVILEFEGTSALVKADLQEKRVYISIKGPVERRRRLLAVIRSDFEHIHSSFMFRPQEMVPVPDHPDLLVPYRKLCVLEERGIKTFTEVLETDVLELEVQKLLRGVDLEKDSRVPSVTDGERSAVRLFYSYSHKDENLRNQLETHLKILQRQGFIQAWHDRRILGGEEWKDEIDRNLEAAHIILLLVSADFIASDYCYQVEMTRALERHEAGEATVIPVILRDVIWHESPLAKLQAFPKGGKPITQWRDRDSAWRDVAEGIMKVVRKIWKVRFD